MRRSCLAWVGLLGFLLGAGACLEPPRSPEPPPGLAELRCDRRLPGVELTTLSAGSGPVVAGPPSEEAARARKLYEAERWSEAAQALVRVANGEAHDDEGNRQIALYRYGVALYRLKQVRESADVFVEIARSPDHLKHAEALLWLAKLVDSVPSVVRALRFYGDRVEHFNNSQQRDIYWKMAFLYGRERYERGEVEEAMRWFERVDRQSPYYEAARDCLSRSRARLSSAPPASAAPPLED